VSHVFMNIRREDGEWRVTCSCGHVSWDASRPVARALHVEHSLSEFEAAS
jgi:hypothetical protein